MERLCVHHCCLFKFKDSLFVDSRVVPQLSVLDESEHCFSTLSSLSSLAKHLVPSSSCPIQLPKQELLQ